MVTSEKGLNIIKEFEGLRLQAYKCPAGVWTIGWGHTKGVKKGMTITEDQAEEYLYDDLVVYETVVNQWSISKYNFMQEEFDALVSFAYNCGTGNLVNLLKNGARTIAQIADALLLYTKANGKELPGLVRRRRAERALFLSAGRLSSNTKSYFPVYVGDSERIDEVLSYVGADFYYTNNPHSAWERRKPIAVANGFPQYTGTAVQNIALIKLAKEGLLRKP